MKIWNFLKGHVDLSDVVVGLGLIALASGLSMVAPWAAYVAVGTVLIWYGLPSRPPFIVRSQKGPEN